MSLWKKLKDKVGLGKASKRRNPFKTCVVKTDTGAPSSAAPVGALCWNSFDGDAYVCTVAAGTWVKINA